MKKYIFTESQVKTIIDNLLMEDDEARKWNTVVQCFLNNKLKLSPPLKEDGIIGSETQKAIHQYQQLIKVIPQDGVWGEITMTKMTPEDKELYKQCKRKKLGYLNSLF